MKCLYFADLPLDVESAAHGRTVMGAKVHPWNTVAAFLAHGTYDQYCLPLRSMRALERFKESALYAMYSDRMTFVSLRDLDAISGEAQLVFLNLGLDISYLTGVRRALRRDRSPITGVVYSVHSLHTLERLARVLLSDARHYDALICPTTSGRTAVHRLAELMASRFASGGFDHISLEPQLPIVPYGIDVSAFTPTPRSLADGVMLRRSLGIPQQATVVLYFGRFSDISKADLKPLLIAFAALDPSSRNAYLILAGDDRQLGAARSLVEFAAKLGQADHVHVIPNPDLHQKLTLYNASDVFVSPSDSLQETAGLTIVEAMSAGLPVIGSDWNGYRDIIKDGDTGFLIHTALPELSADITRIRDQESMASDDLIARTTIVDVEQLSSAMIELISNATLRTRMGKRGAALARTEHDQKIVVGRYESLWDILLVQARQSVRSCRSRFVDTQTLPHLDVFSHYPTGALKVTDTVSKGHLGLDWLQSPECLMDIASPTGWCDPTHLGLITKELQMNGPQRIEDLLERLRAIGVAHDNESSLAHIARLLKYGAVARMASSPDPVTRFSEPSER